MSQTLRRIACASQLPLALTVLATIVAPCWAQSPACLGAVKQPHPHPFGNFNFETNSHHAEASKLDAVAKSGSYKFGIVSCVANPDPDNPLYVHWLIPGPHGWALSKSKLDSAPRLIHDEKVVPLDGCLQYGNRGDNTPARFLGLESDKPRIDDERQRGCRAVAARPQGAPAGKIESILLKFQNWIPSDTKNPAKTMLQLEGTVGVESAEPNRYTSVVKYQLKEHGSEGVVDKISMRPAFRGPTEVLLPWFNGKNPTGIKVAKEGSIAFEVADLVNPRLDYASYEIFDQNNQLVGAVAFPVFISSPQ